MTTIATTLHEATQLLRPVSETARLDSEMLLAHLLGVSRAQLLASLPDELPAGVAELYGALVARRLALEPIAYLIGEREFFGLPLHVDARVLVPRPETETLVARALEIIREEPSKTAWKVADIGTGSGAIAVALAANAPAASIYAVDLSADALDVARRNIERYGLAGQITLLHGAGLNPLPGPVDLILSNPPYTILRDVDENVRRHEPHLALDGGEDGMVMIQELLAYAPRYINRGVMLIEFAAWQGAAVRAVARAAFPRAGILVHQDLAGRDRVLEIDLRDTAAYAAEVVTKSRAT